MFCRKCGANNDDNAFKCVQCGEIIQDIRQVQPVQPVQELPEVASHLVLAILVTLFCCLPLGIVSIVYAAQVNSKLESGNYNSALDCSKKAAIWGWSALGIGLVWMIIYAGIMVVTFTLQHRNF